MGRAISTAREASDRAAAAQYLSRWLYREPLTPKQSETVALHGRLDYEGQLPDILCDLLSVATEVGVIKKLFFMVDQLEDLFTPNYSLLRQSRILTDLRTLIDKQDSGTPLAMILSWSTDVDAPDWRRLPDHVGREIQQRYSALHSRITRELVVINKLREIHATGFAQKYIDPLGEPTQAETSLRPTTSQLAVLGKTQQLALHFSARMR